MIRAFVRLVLALIVLVVIGAIVGLALVFSGRYNVAATYPDSPAVEWLLSTTTDRSVKNHARGIKAPSDLDDGAEVTKGARHYNEGCVGCHGGPGIPIFPIVRAMNPEPPELAKEADEWKPNELFWITKYGIRMTGMPAWRKELSDNEIWSVVAFTHKLPSMSPAEYSKLSASSEQEGKSPKAEDSGKTEGTD